MLGDGATGAVAITAFSAAIQHLSPAVVHTDAWLEQMLGRPDLVTALTTGGDGPFPVAEARAAFARIGLTEPEIVSLELLCPKADDGALLCSELLCRPPPPQGPAPARSDGERAIGRMLRRLKSVRVSLSVLTRPWQGGE